MQRYNPKEIEPKWQKVWEDTKIYEASDTSDKPKRFILEFFPYPSGAAMHVGHVRNYAIGDAISRFARMRGNEVLHPMGWDAFGLPAENYAIKNGISPRTAIDQNTGRFKQQLTQMGFGYDWSREIDSTSPEYYKWTQWFFLLLFKKGLAYQQESLQWWCPVDKTVLANEQVENGHCWRCGSEVEKKALKQWFFKITEYADRLAKDLDDVDWSDSIKNMQRNWIGRSTGAEIVFNVEDSDQQLKVFTTRADTLYGATFMVLAPEHPLVPHITAPGHLQQVENYQQKTRNKSDIERQETNREKTGVFTGAYAINPVNGAKLPIWIADYVLAGYGTGAIMAVPAHDERDHEFAKQFDLPIIEVVQDAEEAGEGTLINSDEFNGLATSEAREKIITALEEKGVGEFRTNYKMRDWLISRQRYWGAPIPIIHCPEHGAVAVPDAQLPVVLPEMTSFEPAGDGRSPLARVPEFVHTTCPECGGPATRETDTMDGFACSSWYFWRYIDPRNSEKPFDQEKVRYWAPVDEYIGGAEHAVMHLLYVRFWTKVMFDEGILDFEEPIISLRNQGMILAPDGQKMSKSKGNTIQPDDLIEQGYGADAIRIMELFIGPWNQSANWSVEGMGGSFRFLQRVWNLAQEFIGSEARDNTADAANVRRITHKTIKKVSEDLEHMSFNTAIAAMMEAINDFYKEKAQTPYAQAADAWKEAIEALLQLLAPFAPHITEELWHQLGNESTIHLSEWPVHDDAYLAADTITVVVQVNGKLRAQVEVSADADKDTILAQIQTNEKVQASLAGQEIRKTIFVPGKLVNFVV